MFKKKGKSKTKEPRRLPKVYQEEADERLKERKAKKKERDETPVEPEKPQEVEDVARFSFITQTSGTANYTGPSGMNYISNLGTPFEVRNKADIKFFEDQPNRFRKQGILSKAPEKPKDLDVQLMDYLKGIKGVSRVSREKVVKEYISKNNLVDEIQQYGYKLHKSIPTGHAKKIGEFVLKELKGDL